MKDVWCGVILALAAGTASMANAQPDVTAELADHAWEDPLLILTLDITNHQNTVLYNTLDATLHGRSDVDGFVSTYDIWDARRNNVDECAAFNKHISPGSTGAWTLCFWLPPDFDPVYLKFDAGDDGLVRIPLRAGDGSFDAVCDMYGHCSDQSPLFDGVVLAGSGSKPSLDVTISLGKQSAFDDVVVKKRVLTLELHITNNHPADHSFPFMSSDRTMISLHGFFHNIPVSYGTVIHSDLPDGIDWEAYCPGDNAGIRPGESGRWKLCFVIPERFTVSYAEFVVEHRGSQYVSRVPFWVGDYFIERCRVVGMCSEQRALLGGRPYTFGMDTTDTRPRTIDLSRYVGMAPGTNMDDSWERLNVTVNGWRYQITEHPDGDDTRIVTAWIDITNTGDTLLTDSMLNVSFGREALPPHAAFGDEDCPLLQNDSPPGSTQTWKWCAEWPDDAVLDYMAVLAGSRLVVIPVSGEAEDRCGGEWAGWCTSLRRNTPKPAVQPVAAIYHPTFRTIVVVFDDVVGVVDKGLFHVVTHNTNTTLAKAAEWWGGGAVLWFRLSPDDIGEGPAELVIGTGAIIHGGEPVSEQTVPLSRPD